MFRKPRNIVTEGQTQAVKPSTGRAPTPPRSPPSHKETASTNATSLAMTSILSPLSRTSAPLSSNGALGGSESERATSGRNNKLKSKGNASILSFFKKVDVDRDNSSNDTLFLVDDSSRKFTTLKCDGALLHETTTLMSDLEADEARFNEFDTPTKRRRLSPQREVGSAISLPENTGFEAASEQLTRSCSPIANDANHNLNSEKHSFERTDHALIEKAIIDSDDANLVAEHGLRLRGPLMQGPFLEDSDSDDDTPFGLAAHQKPTQVPCVPFTASTDDVKIKIESVDDTALQEPPEIGTYPPHLKREDTSYAEGDGFAGFEEMGDFDDEFADGDEVAARRWMTRKGLDGEFCDTFDGEEFLDREEDEEEEEPKISDESCEIPAGSDNTAACPICSASFAGISDEEASIHVNHCLDGNPTPLPISKSAGTIAPTTSELQPPAAKFRRAVRPAKPGQQNPFTLGTPNGTSSAFSMLMSGHAEDAAWANAAAAENAARGKPAFERTCPFYKILPGLFICVDAFRYGAVEGCNAYFLSHFHSDHYIGLTSTWCHGPIYCSRATANLVRQQLRVDSKWVVDLEFEKKVEVPGTNGVHVTMIPANHCPGSSLYLFEKVVGKGKNPKVQRILHCGDFRACPAHVEHPLLRPDVIDAVSGKTAQQKLDVCYLDTTYLNPKYAFPSQEDVIQACADMCVSLSKSTVDKSDGYEQMKTERAGGAMSQFVRSGSKDNMEPNIDDHSMAETKVASTSTNKGPVRGRLLVVVGTYSIGKERICLGIARALNSKIYAPPGKQRICAALEDAELNAYLTRDPRAAQVHMTPLFEIRAETLGDYLAEFGDTFSRCVGFRPSGWNYRPPGSRFVESPAVGTVLYSENWKSGYTMRELVPQRGSTTRAACYGVPYSEHSSFRELTMFCCALRIEKIIPTVNIGSAKSREKMKLWCERWAAEKKKNGLFKVTKDGRSEWFPGKGTMELRTTL